MALCLVQQLVPEDLHGAGAVTDEAGLHTQNQALDLAQLVLISEEKELFLEYYEVIKYGQGDQILGPIDLIMPDCI